MQNNIKFLLFLILITGSYKLEASTCSLNLIKKEVTKFHGPEWSKISKDCSNNQIKSHLKEIILKPENSLVEYDQEQQKFIFRNAVKSYGHFGTQNSDLNFLSHIYNDKNNILTHLFGTDANFFRITILESMANTGNPEALNFYEKILENDNNVLFLQQSAIDFASWIFEGTPLLHQNNNSLGSKIYAEVFAPNLKDSAEKRFKNNQEILDKIWDKKIKFKHLLSDMLLRSDRFLKIKPSLEKLKTVLTTYEEYNQPLDQKAGIEADTVKVNDHQGNFKNSASKEKQMRAPSSANEIEETKSNHLIWVTILVLSCIGLIILIRRKLS
jgi:hypothetical protein